MFIVFNKMAARRVALMFMAGVLFIVVMVAMSIQSAKRAQLMSAWVNHTGVVISNLKDLLSTLESAESNGRGFVITQKPEYHTKYEHEIGSIDSKLAKLADSVTDNPIQAERVAALTVLVHSRFDHFQTSLGRIMAGTPATIRPGTGVGTQLMELVHTKADEIEADEHRLFKTRYAAYEASTARTRNWMIASGALAAIITSGAGLLLQRELRARRESEKKLSFALQSKSNFLASVSHEVRTPLNSIIGIADVLAETPLTVEQERCVHIFNRAAQSLLHLLDDVLDLAKLEGSRFELHARQLNLQDLIRGCADLMAFRADQKGLRLAVRFDADVPPSFLGDGNRIRQILLNLIGNAIKFTPKGNVDVHVSWRDKSIVIAVADTGIGIAEDRKKFVFEKFNQLEPSVYTDFGGTGLGLAIAKQLTEFMGGRIWFESQEGVGTTFTFLLPLPVVAPVISAPSAVALQSARALRILVVDDMEDNRSLIELLLMQQAHHLDFAEDGKSAYEKFTQSQFDMVLMDMHMPDVDGFAATRKIREWEKMNGKAPTPIIALTAFVTKDEVDRSLAAGCTLHVAKPVTKELLGRVLNDHGVPSA